MNLNAQSVMIGLFVITVGAGFVYGALRMAYLVSKGRVRWSMSEKERIEVFKAELKGPSGIALGAAILLWLVAVLFQLAK